jgi:hypothetical protein
MVVAESETRKLWRTDSRIGAKYEGLLEGDLVSWVENTRI